MRTVFPFLLLSIVIPRPLVAQWRVGLEWSVTRYGGSAHDTSSSHVASNGRPGDAGAIGIRLDRSGRRWGFGVGASYAKPGFAVSGQGITLTDKTSGDLIELSPFVSTRVGGIGPSGAIRAELGPALHLWDFQDELRTRLGAKAALTYEWPMAGRFSGRLRLEGLLSKSWFDAADVPPEFERRVTWRYAVGLGLHCGL